MLSFVANTFVLSKESMTNLISHSNLIKQWVADAVATREWPLDTNIRDLSYAPHRFDSCQKPFARLCVFLPAIIAVAAKVVSSRKGVCRHLPRT